MKRTKRSFTSIILTGLMLAIAFPMFVSAETPESSAVIEPILKTDIEEGYYNVKNEYSSKYLNLAGGRYEDGGEVIQYHYEARSNSVLYFSKNTDSSYTIKFFHSKKVLDEDVSGKRVLQWGSHGGDNQRWFIYEGEAGKLYIKNKATGNWISFSSMENVEKPTLTTVLNAGDSRYIFSLEKVTELPRLPYVLAEIEDGYYYIKNEYSSKYLNLSWARYEDGGEVIQYYFEEGSNSVLKFSKNADGSYTIKFLHSKMALDEDIAGRRVLQWSSHGGDNQKWLIYEGEEGKLFIRNKATGDWIYFGSTSSLAKPILSASVDLNNNNFAYRFEEVATLPTVPYVAGVANGTYMVKSKSSDLYFDIAGVSLKNGANLIQWTKNVQDNQKFIIKNTGQGSIFYILYTEHVLDVYGGSTENGANIIQWPYHGGLNQLWDLRENNDGSISIYSRLSGKVLEARDSSTSPGAMIVQWTYNGGNSQSWYFEKAPLNTYAGSTIYLTFDDGPSSSITPGILDILAQEGVKATFFVEGIYAADYGYLMQRIVNEGHTIAIHCYSHNYAAIYSSPSAYFNDLYSAINVVRNVTGVESKILRFPGGSSNTVSRNYYPGIMSYLVQEVQNRGFHYFDWNVSSGDTASIGSSGVYFNVISGLGNKSTYVVLMHDRSGNYQTLNALRDIIRYGKNRGYRFDRITMTTPQIHHPVAN